jgi:hypothetical protein
LLTKESARAAKVVNEAPEPASIQAAARSDVRAIRRKAPVATPIVPAAVIANPSPPAPVQPVAQETGTARLERDPVAPVKQVIHMSDLEQSPEQLRRTVLKRQARDRENAKAEQLVDESKLLAADVRRHVREAKQDDDIMRVTCLNDKLTQIEVNLRSLVARNASMLAARTEDARKHELTVIAVLDQKLDVLGREARQCIGVAYFSE